MQEINIKVATRGNHGIYEVDSSFDGSYLSSLDRMIREMRRLVAKGAEIVWSTNERFCIINGKTFNVSKIVWDARTHAVSL